MGESPLTIDCRNDVGREDVGVDEVLLALEMLNHLEVCESPGVPGLVPLRIQMRGSLV